MPTASTTHNGRGLIVFDGDDTLWSTMPLYTAAKKLFAALVADLVSPATAILRLDEIDRKNVHVMGFSTNRFPSSLLECYRVLCTESGRLASRHIEDSLVEIGRSVFTTPAPNVPNANAVLNRLSQQFNLVLATKGDPALQWGRIRQSTLDGFFREVYVLDFKTSREFESILVAQNCAPPRAWSVGNSVRSDINPALQIGMSAVLVPSSTWDYEDEPLMASPRAFVADTLSEAAELIIGRIA